MLDRDQLETFATIVELQSFERAAGALRITRGAVSQRIKALEQSLAAVLLVREKPVVATPAGETLLRHVQALRMLEGSTLRELALRAQHIEPWHRAFLKGFAHQLDVTAIFFQHPFRRTNLRARRSNRERLQYHVAGER